MNLPFSSLDKSATMVLRRVQRCEPAFVKSVIYIVTLVIAIAFIAFLIGKEGVQIRYSIIFDSESKSSKMYVYKLKWEQGLWTLLGNYYDSKPIGLSFYAENPRIAAISLRPMLVNAKGKVPTAYHHITQLSLGATLSLKSLEDRKGDEILKAIKMLFYGKRISPFQSGTVDYLNGAEKGFYLWATISFLLNQTFVRSNVAVLDLGEGFMQVAFLPTKKYFNKTVNKSDYQEFPILDQKVSLYAKSFRMGLKTARNEIINTGGPNHSSPCIAPQVTFLSDAPQFVKYETSIANFSKCYEDCKRYVTSSTVEALPDLEEREIFATSSYFEMATKLKMIPEDAAMGDINLEKIKCQAEEACRVLIDKKDTLCADLTYLYALLRDGFMIPHNKTIHVVKEIHRQKVTWTLGMALSQIYLASDL